MELIIPEPNEKQKQFLAATKRNVGFGGARGGGKSWVVRVKAIILALYYPGIKVLIVRRTYPEIHQNHVIYLRSMLKGIAKYNDKNKVFNFENGSTINFKYCRNDADLENFQGSEYDVIFIDEATQFSEHQMKIITACLRGVNNFPHRIYYTCNPGGQGHAYIKRIFIDKKYEPDEEPSEYEFIQSLVTDNVALMKNDPNYIKWLDALPPKIKKAWRYGDWNIFEGQFFEDFVDDEEHYNDRRWTHVINPLPVSSIRNMNIYRSYDFGYAKPFSCGWWGVDSDGVIYRLLELYGCTKTPNEGVKWNPDKQFQEIKRVEEEHPYLKGKNIQGVADPAIWDKSNGVSIAETAEKYNIYFDKGDNKRIPGWMQMHYRLAFDENGYPMMYIFKNCKQFIRTIPLQMYDETHVEDLDTSLEDHIADETRYFCMSRPISPRETQEPKAIYDDPLNMIADMKKRR